MQISMPMEKYQANNVILYLMETGSTIAPSGNDLQYHHVICPAFGGNNSVIAALLHGYIDAGITTVLSNSISNP